MPLYFTMFLYDKDFLRFQSLRSAMWFPPLSGFSGIWQPPAPCIVPQGHTCRARPFPKWPWREGRMLDQRRQPGSAGHTQRWGLLPEGREEPDPELPPLSLPTPCALPHLADMPSLLLLLRQDKQRLWWLVNQHINPSFHESVTQGNGSVSGHTMACWQPWVHFHRRHPNVATKGKAQLSEDGD